MDEIAEIKESIYTEFVDTTIGKFYRWQTGTAMGFYHVYGKSKTDDTKYDFVEFMIYDSNTNVSGVERQDLGAHMIYNYLAEGVSEITKEEYRAGVKLYIQIVNDSLAEWSDDNDE